MLYVGTGTHNVEHDVVAQARRTVDADQNAVFDGGAKTYRQPVRPRAGPFVVRPRVCDQTASFAEDVGGAGCGNTRKTHKAVLSTVGQSSISSNQSITAS